MIKALIFDCFGVLVEVQKNHDILADILELRKNYKIAVLSNTNKATFERFFSNEMTDMYFDELILSHEEDIAKPDPEIFILAACRLNVKTEECVFIDDSIYNILAAKNVGMKTILYKNIEDFHQKLENLR